MWSRIEETPTRRSRNTPTGDRHMIVMGTRGAAGSKYLLGSVAEGRADRRRAVFTVRTPGSSGPSVLTPAGRTMSLPAVRPGMNERITSVTAYTHAGSRRRGGPRPRLDRERVGRVERHRVRRGPIGSNCSSSSTAPTSSASKPRRPGRPHARQARTVAAARRGTGPDRSGRGGNADSD